MSRHTLFAALAVTGAMLSVAPAFAAEGGTFEAPIETFVGRYVSTVPTCPSWDFHLTEARNGTLTGMAFDPMMTGKMSSLSGTVATDGVVHLTAAPMGGTGASGAVSGAMHGTTMVLTMAGGACPMASVKLMPVQHVIADPAG